jgi:hypothetical protein
MCPSPRSANSRKWLQAFVGNFSVCPHIRRGADKSLARPTSRCRRTESRVSLERGVCSCAELQVGLGPSFMKIWTCGSSPRSGSRNAWRRIKNVNGASRLRKFGFFFRRNPNDFLSRLLTMDETWLYHYDPDTQQQSVEWRYSVSTCPKKYGVQKSARKILASIFWDQVFILLIDYLTKGQNI